jgi:small subunit ribosomal protein S1
MTDNPTETQEAPKIVEGSDGYLIEVDGEIVPNYDATINVFAEGDIVTGKVVRIDKDEVLVDIGYKSEGVIPVNELSIRKNVNTLQEVELGEEVDALVMQKEDADGRLILSKKRARFEKAWKRIEGAFESGTPVIGTVIEVVKGGLILDLGVRGFLPASLVDIRRVQDLSEYVTKELNCRVIEMNRNRNNVVLSRRAVLEEERKEVRQQIIDELTVGDIVEGTISNIVDFGAFVDLDGIDGLIHISELSWTHINHPSEVLQVNQKVKVKVLDIDRDRQRISLGLKQTQEDPWQRIVTRHKVGDTVDGRVTKIVAFGAFIEIYEGIEGLVHISELANRHVERPDEVVAVGQTVHVKIIEVDTERRRLSLSIKRVEGADDVRPTPPMPVEIEEPEAEMAEEPEAEVAEETEAVEAETADETVAEETAEVAAEEVAEAPADEAAETVTEETAVEPEAAADTVTEEAAAEAEVAAESEAAAEPETTEEPEAAAATAEEPEAAAATAEEPAAAEPVEEAEEPAGEVAPPLDEGPTLGLSDEVFPVGAEARDEASDAGEAEAEPQA